MNRNWLFSITLFGCSCAAFSQSSAPVAVPDLEPGAGKSGTPSVSGLNPAPIERALLAAASKAQEIPNSAALEKAWAYYGKWQGAWQAGHAKPTGQDREEVIAYTDSLLKPLKKLAETEKLGKSSLDFDRLKKAAQVGSPEFNASRQNENTQALKALAIMGLTEHELDIRHPDPVRNGVKMAYLVLEKLEPRTPLDPDIYFFMARIALDAQQNEFAWTAARLGAYMKAEPEDHDLEFVCFIGAAAAGEQWPAIQKMIREVAGDAAQADRVLAKAAPFFSGKIKFQNVPPAR